MYKSRRARRSLYSGVSRAYRNDNRYYRLFAIQNNLLEVTEKIRSAVKILDRDRKSLEDDDISNEFRELISALRYTSEELDDSITSLDNMSKYLKRQLEK